MIKYVAMNYVLNELDGKRASALVFKSRQEAKVERNRLSNIGTVCVVSRGPEHPHGASRPDPRCRNTEKTGKQRIKKMRAPKD